MLSNSVGYQMSSNSVGYQMPSHSVGHPQQDPRRYGIGRRRVDYDIEMDQR
jgi:hypothetical protein